MLLYTIAPVDFIMQQSEGQSGPTCKSCRYGFMEGMEDSEGFHIQRIISTDPKAYLDSSFSPGQIYRR